MIDTGIECGKPHQGGQDMMAKLALAARILLGLAFTVFGLNGLFEFFEAPPIEGAGGELIDAFMASGYFWTFLKLCESACGIFLLIGRFVPLALLVLAPIVLNILLFHVFMDPAGLPIGLVTSALGIFVAYSYRGSFAGVLKGGARPS